MISFLGSGGQVNHDCPFCFVSNPRGNSRPCRNGQEWTRCLIAVALTFQRAAESPEGLFKQRLWTPPLQLLILRILGCSESVLGEPLFRIKFQSPIKVMVPTLNSSPTLCPYSIHSRHARHGPASGPWRVLSLLLGRPFPSYLYSSLPNFLKVFIKRHSLSEAFLCHSL